MTSALMRGLLLLTVTFAAGVAVGVAIDRSIAERRAGVVQSDVGMPQGLDRLQLAPSQRRAVDSILARIDPESEAAMRDLIPRLAGIADSEHRALARILSPSQLAVLDSMTTGPTRLFLLKRKDSAGGVRVDTIRER